MPAEPLVVTAMTRGLAAYRPLALAYAAVLVWVHREEMNRAWVAAVVLAGLGAWTLTTLVFRRITWTTVAVDLALASGGILATSLAYPRASVVAGALTLPGIWSCSGVVGAAIKGGGRAGLLGALVIAIADLVSVVRPNFGTVHNIVLLFLVGGLIGLSASLARESQTHLEASVRSEQAYAERERLARVVHDGVLQTLSFVNRRGHEIGGQTGPLADLAAEQERSLRALISGIRDAAVPDGHDLTKRLRAFEGTGVVVSTPVDPVTLPVARADELIAAVAAAVDNVRRHAGPDAKAWLLLEDLGPEVAVTVRDNGRGMPPGRLPEAAREGRMGASASIRGRLESLGGTASWESEPDRGTTVTLRAPKTLELLTRRRGAETVTGRTSR